MNVQGTSTFTSASDITLDDATNDFVGAVSASGMDVTLRDTNALELADIEVSGDLVVTAGGPIDDGPQVGVGSDVNVQGTSTITSASNITLDDATNDFVGAVNASGAEITLSDTCLLYTSPSPRDGLLSRMPSSA